MSLIVKAMEKLRADAAAAAPASRGVNALRALSAASRAEASPEHAVPSNSNAKRISIDRGDLRAACYFPEQGCDARFANYYRQIKRPILQRAFTPDGSADLQLVILTSALPGDGKTFNSLNLAFSMARERDSTVLLVDADVPKPNISRILGIEQEPGLLDAVVNETLDVESLVLRTDVPGLEVLASGTPVENASELLTSARMQQISARLCGSNPRRVVLFDAPPLLVSSEARALLSLSGQVVLVVRAGRTPRRAVQQALGLMDEEKLTGLILNEGRGGLNDGYYGYSNYGVDENQGVKAE